MPPSEIHTRRRFRSGKHLAILVLLTVFLGILLSRSSQRQMAAGGCATPTFNAALVFPVGQQPLFVVAGDFNGDGNPDLATANGHPLDDISILLGDGTGGFSPAPSIPGGSNGPANFLAVGDFNSDGKLDLAVAGRELGKVTVFFGDGHGAFPTSLSYSAGNGPMTVADFNGDGLIDLAMANSGSHTVSIFLGAGSGGLAQAKTVTLPVSYAPSAMDSGDLNGDHKTDLIVVDNGGAMADLIGDGTGNFTVIPVLNPSFRGARLIKIADFNNDGKADIVTSEVNGVFMNVLLGDGTGNFPLQIRLNNLGPNDLVVGDFNRDGNADFAVSSTARVSVMLGNGNGAFSRQDYAVGSLPVRLTVNDFNKDLLPDLAVLNSKSNNVSVLLGDGAGGFAASRNYSTQLPTSTGGADPAGIAAADFNRDGHLDVAVTNFFSRNVAVFLGDGTGRLSAPVMYSVGSETPTSIALADFDNDGKVDIAVPYLGSTHDPPFSCGILHGNGDGTFAVVVKYPLLIDSASAIAAGDLNNDGKADLVLLSGGTLITILSNGSGFLEEHSVQVGPNPNSVTLADLNGDGKLDFIVPVVDGASTPNQPKVWIGFGDGTGGFSNVESLNVGTSVEGVAVGDLNGDGKVDLAVTCGFAAGHDGVSILIGDGNGNFTLRESHDTGSGPFGVAIGDFNGNAKSGLAVTGTDWNTLSILVGQGGGSVAGSQDYGTGAAPKYVVTADLNEDGKSDVVTANATSGEHNGYAFGAVCLDNTYAHSDAYANSNSDAVAFTSRTPGLAYGRELESSDSIRLCDNAAGSVLRANRTKL